MNYGTQSTIYFLVGIPGSGKSTWASQQNIPILSSDAIREERTGSRSDFDKISHSEVFDSLRSRAQVLLEKGQDFVYDATNLNKYHRQKELFFWQKKWNPNIVGVVFTTPKEVAEQRNSVRPADEVVPQEDIDRMWDKAHDEPIDTYADWFDEIVLVDENGNETRVYENKEATREGWRVVVTPTEVKRPRIRR